MKYYSGKTWYPKEELHNKTSIIDDFEKYLSKGISERVKIIKKDCGLTLAKMYGSKPSRISQIMKCKYPESNSKKYSSFITNAILCDIIEAGNKVKRRKGKRLPKIITRFWIIFGEEEDLREFMSRVYYNICLRVLVNKSMQDGEWADIIRDLLYADASFSFVFGQAEIDNQDINAGPNAKEQRALVSAMEYTWNIISDEVIKEFRKSFDHDDPSFDYAISDSKMINKQISTWRDDVLMTYLKRKREEYKNDSIANIGYCVHNLMEMLFEKRNIDKNYVPSQCDDNFGFTLEKSDKYLLDCAENLVKSQQTYFENIRNSELEISIAESVEKAKNYEWEGDFYEIGTGKKISFDSSGKTFEELISEAIKTCRRL